MTVCIISILNVINDDKTTAVALYVVNRGYFLVGSHLELKDT